MFWFSFVWKPLVVWSNCEELLKLKYMFCFQVSNRNSGAVIPPPLVRGGAQVTKPGSHNTVVMPPLVRGSQVCTAVAWLPLKEFDLLYKSFLSDVRVLQTITVTPQQIATLRQQQQHSGTGPPPLLLGARTSVPSVQVQGQRIIQQGLIRVANANVLVSQVTVIYLLYTVLCFYIYTIVIAVILVDAVKVFKC